MKLHVNLPELVRVGELLRASVLAGHDADTRLRDRVQAQVERETAGRRARQQRALRVAVEGHAAEAALRTQVRYR